MVVKFFIQFIFLFFCYSVSMAQNSFFDDIHLSRQMDNFWDGLKNDKYDLTEIGHHSGTGIAIF